MVKVYMFKMPFETPNFNNKQKVWVQMSTGAMAALVTGKFRGKNRYVSSWVNWDRGNQEKYPFPEFIKVEVDKNFACKHRLEIAN